MSDERSLAEPDTRTEGQAKPADRWPGWLFPAVLAGFFWAYVIASGIIEMPIFTRFLSRLAVAAIWVLAFLVWWLTRRQLSWRDRLLPLGVAIVFAALAEFLKHATVDGPIPIMLGVPLLLTLWTSWLLAARFVPPHLRRRGLLIAVA